MKKIIKNLTAVSVLTMALTVTAMPASAATASKTAYLPGTETYYYWKEGKWVRSYVEKTAYTAKGLIKSNTHTEYDENGKKTAVYKTKNTYKAGNIITSKYYSGGKLSTTTKYTYNKKGLNTKVTTTDSNGRKTYSAVYTYNKKKLLTKSVEKNFSNGKTAETTTIKNTYDKKGKLKKSLKKTVRNDGLESTVTSTYSYKSGRLSKEKSNNKWSSGESYSNEYTYNSDGNIVTEKSENIYSEGGSGASITTNTYNKKGFITKAVEDYSYTYEGYNDDGTTSAITENNTQTRTYSYKYYKKKYIKQEIEKVDGVNQTKTVYGSFKKVKLRAQR